MEEIKSEIGQIIKVRNSNKIDFSKECEYYYAIWSTDIDGKEICLFFTEKELDVAKQRAVRHLEDIPTKIKKTILESS